MVLFLFSVHIDGNFAVTQGEFLLLGNATEQTTHCAVEAVNTLVFCRFTLVAVNTLVMC